MILALIVIFLGLFLVIFRFAYRTKNIRQTERSIQSQPASNADFEGTIRRWYQFTWNPIQLLTAYNSPRNSGGKFLLVNNQLVLLSADNQEVFRLPVADLRIDLITTPALWVYVDKSHRYQIRLLQNRNPLEQFDPYKSLEQALVKVRGTGYSNTK